MAHPVKQKHHQEAAFDGTTYANGESAQMDRSGPALPPHLVDAVASILAEVLILEYQRDLANTGGTPGGTVREACPR